MRRSAFRSALSGWKPLLAWGVSAFALIGIFQWYTTDLPYQRLREQVKSLRSGTPIQQVRAQVERPPETACLSAGECKNQLWQRYSHYQPNPLQKVRGPVLVYRVVDIDDLVCLFFDERQKLVDVAHFKQHTS